MNEAFPRAIPSTWQLATLEDIAQLVRGVTYKKEEARPSGAPSLVPVLRATNITGSSLTFDDLVFVPSARVSTDQLLVVGDVVVASSSGSKEVVGKAGQLISNSFSGSFGGFCTAVRPDTALSASFVGYYFQSPEYRKAISGVSAGSNINNIKSSDFAQHLIPVAPLAEQNRIVSKLEELLSDLDAGVAELKAAQKKLQQYRQSLLKAAVEGSLTAAWREAHPAPEETGADLLARILRERRAGWETQQLAKFETQGKAPPKGWEGKYPEPVGPDRNDLPQLPADWTWASVDQLSRSVRNGISNTPNKDGVGLPILRINAVRPMQVRLAEIRHLDVPAGEVSDYFVEAGDLLATRYNGSVDLLGVFGLVRGVTGPVLHPDKLIRIKPVLDRALGLWLEIAANSGASRRYIVGRVKTTAGQTGISGEDLKKMPIPLPPLAEQSVVADQIAVLLATVEQQVNSVERGLAQSTAQRQNLLRAAFAGQLVPQDPADEPASALLGRIRAERAAAQPAAKGRRSSKVSV